MVRVWAVLAGVTLALSVYLIKPRVPPRRMRSHERGPWLATDGAFLRDPIMLLTLGTSFVSSLSTFPVSLYLATYASNLTPSAFEAEVVVGIYNVASSFGCAFTGWLADIDYPLATTFCGVAGAIAAFASWGLADSLAKAYGFAVLAGFTSQIIAAWSGCARDVSGGNPYVGSLVFGVLAGSRGLASIAMPFISEELYRPGDEKESWGRFGFYRMMLFGSSLSRSDLLSPPPPTTTSSRVSPSASQLASRRPSRRSAASRSRSCARGWSSRASCERDEGRVLWCVSLSRSLAELLVRTRADSSSLLQVDRRLIDAVKLAVRLSVRPSQVPPLDSRRSVRQERRPRTSVRPLGDAVRIFAPVRPRIDELRLVVTGRPGTDPAFLLLSTFTLALDRLILARYHHTRPRRRSMRGTGRGRGGASARGSAGQQEQQEQQQRCVLISSSSSYSRAEPS